MGCLCSTQDERISSGNASKTMMVQATIRHIGHGEKYTNDYLAKYFINSNIYYPTATYLPSAAKRLMNHYAPGLYGFSVCRSFLGDQMLEKFLQEESNPQILNCGAGFCTRFERYRDLLEQTGATYIELDIEQSQKEKLRLIESARDTIRPRLENVHFMTIDFAKESLQDVLLPENNPQSCFDPERKTLVFWEGVACYLDQSAVDVFFQFVVNHTAPGSLIQMDLIDEKILENDIDWLSNKFGAKEVLEQCEKAGEPLKSGISFKKEESEAYLRERGLRFFGGFGGENYWSPERIDRDFLNAGDRAADVNLIVTLETTPTSSQ